MCISVNVFVFLRSTLIQGAIYDTAFLFMFCSLRLSLLMVGGVVYWLVSFVAWTKLPYVGPG